MGKNVTLRLDEGILKRCRHVAVEEEKSLSEWVAEVLARALVDQSATASAKNRVLQFLQKGFDLSGQPLSRNEAHER